MPRENVNIQGFFFDARYIRIDHHDGISRFSAGLFSAINELADVTAIVSDLRQLEKLPAGAKFIKVSSPTSALEPLLALQLNRAGSKIVFSPMQTMGTLGRKFKVVLTVHDLIYYRHPTPPPSFSFFVKLIWRLYHLSFWPQRLLLNRADTIVAVSETTRNLIIQNHLTKKPVHVIHNAPDHRPPYVVANKRVMPSKRRALVYMGSFMDYKNVEVLISGMQHLPDYELHLLSRISDERKAELSRLLQQRSNVIFHDGIGESEYQHLLSEAFALVSGSREEGFGIPLVEAMSLGTPIVVSDIEIFREIGGSAAKYFDQENPQSFAGQIEMLASAEAWQQASQASLNQALKFSWEISAKKLLELIKQI